MIETKLGREQKAHEWHLGPKPKERGRRCEATLSECATAEQMAQSGQVRQQGKVNAYASEIKGILLCEPCRRKCVRLGLEPHKLTKVEVLPVAGPKRTGFAIPNLKPIREAAGISRYDLARRAECSERTIRDIENQRYRPSLALINRIALVVRANVRDLRGEDSESSAEAGAA